MHHHTEVCGGKGLTIDRGTHVPMIANWPGTIPASVVQHDLIDVCDHLPTIMEAAGVEFPEGYVLDGRSFYPQLIGEEGNPRDWIFFHFEPMSGRVHRPAQRFVRDHKWKLYEDGRLYDISIDDEEQHPSFDEDDDEGRALARRHLEPIFGQMKN